MPVSLTVEYYQTPTQRSQVYGYALRVKVTESEGIPTKIFVYQRGEHRINSGNYIDRFINIASPVDMDNVPEDEPMLDSGIPYYRTDEVILYFRCLEDLVESKNDIDADISHLIETYKQFSEMENFELTETKIYE